MARVQSELDRREQNQMDRLESKLDQLILTLGTHQVYTEREFGKRPTRAEVISWAVAFGALLGTIGFMVPH